MIAREADRLTRLTRALLVLARADARRAAAPRRRAPSRRCSNRWPPRSRAPTASTSASTARPARDLGDADLLEQALSSLATNAVQHTTRAGDAARPRDNGSVVIEVADTGSGIPPPDRARIFDRFYRGGDETAASASASRSPARPSARSAARSSSSPSQPSARRYASCWHAADGDGGDVSPRILVVDDEPSLVRGLTYALEREKFEVEVVTDGEAAVDAALRRLDLVILDLMLPRLSGEEACRQIRARERRADHHADRQGLRARPASPGSSSAPTTT